MHILGISAYYHDSAAALIHDSEIIAAAQEERFTRKKNDPGFPVNAIQYCLKEAGISLGEVDTVVFYDKPLIKFERLLETYLACAPIGFRSFHSAMPVWIKEKLFLKPMLLKELAKMAGHEQKSVPRLFFTQHHHAHAASAFFPGPFQRAAVLCLDGVGEWATTTLWRGIENRLDPVAEIGFPHSLGLLYSAFTYYTGFKVNSGEYKVMGLAPYGEPRYVELIRDNLVEIKADGTYRLNMEYFGYTTGLTMTNRKFDTLFGGPPRQPESDLTQKEMDIARSIQDVTEEIVLRLSRSAYKETGEENLCLAGGVALNCVANSRVMREGPFKNIWIQPAAGDAGGALGAALAVWHQYHGKPRTVSPASDSMKGAYLGPSFSEQESMQFLERAGIPYERLADDELFSSLTGMLESEQVIGWFDGRMEYGPRALCARSIIADARSPKMQSVMNLKIKNRESFRPFAPVVLEESISDVFEIDRASPYMLLVANVRKNLRKKMTSKQRHMRGIKKLQISHSTIPAVTHVDYSARIQSVSANTNPRFHQLLTCFHEKTGSPVLVNTSFNVRGEPIVCTPEDAYRCFMRTEMDFLVIGNLLLDKKQQTKVHADNARQEEIKPDLNQPPTKKQLRTFGLMMAGFVSLIFGLFFPFVFGMQWSFWPWIVGLVFALTALALPGALRSFYWIWTRIGTILGPFNSRIVLGAVFYFVIVPFGLCMRLLRKDPLKRRWNEDVDSYWARHKADDMIKRMEKPF